MPTMGMARPASPARPARSAANSSQLDPAAAMALSKLSVEGQRSLPSPAWRLDLLKVVGSRPAARANPEAVRRLRWASASMARQTWVCGMTENWQDLSPMYRKEFRERAKLR